MNDARLEGEPSVDPATAMGLFDAQTSLMPPWRKANFAAAGETEMRLFIVPAERRADRNLAIA